MEPSEQHHSHSRRNNMKPEQSLDVLAGILQQIALPAVAPDGQLSHAVITSHLQNISAALQPPSETKEEKP